MTEVLLSHQLDRAAKLLQEGKLVAFPTETVYGLGARIFDPVAIGKIFQVKGRPPDNPLIAHISDLDQLGKIAVDLPPLFFLLAQHFFPGPLTIVLTRHPHVPEIVSAGLPTIAVRMPSHPLARELIAKVGVPLVAPSANLSGKPSATSASHVLEDFNGVIDAIVEGGETEIGIESTVVHLLGKQVVLLRPGAVSKEAIEAVSKQEVIVHADSSDAVVYSPGMKYRHYSPTANVKTFFELERLLTHLQDPTSLGKKMLLSRLPIGEKQHFVLSSKALYSQLRTADREGYNEVWIFCDEEIQRDSALMNRITRASDQVVF